MEPRRPLARVPGWPRRRTAALDRGRPGERPAAAADRASDAGALIPLARRGRRYGAGFKTEISGDYWTRATEDIHAGIDLLIARGVAHPDSLGLMGWSAGGHWSNWMLVTTDRFKAIASGAGTANWISLYGQTDKQDSREFYLGRDPEPGAANKPWDDFDHWWNESPLKYIHNAATPTLIHFGEKDERIPMPQGQELHMALKLRGVPTEFMVYPGEPHGLREPRNLRQRPRRRAAAWSQPITRRAPRAD